MSFDDKYEILAELRNDGIKTVVTREKATGQALEAHLFLAGRTPENSALLTQIERLGPDQRQYIVESGDHEGTPYVVTRVLPNRSALREWLATGAPASSPQTDFQKGATLPSFQAYDPSKGATLPPFQAPSDFQKGATLPSFQAFDPAKGATLPPFQAPSMSDVVKGATLPAFQAFDPEKGATLPPFQAVQPGGHPAQLPMDPQGAKKGADDDFLRLCQVPERGKGGLSTSSAPATPVPGAKGKDPGEFTRLFQSSPLAAPKPAEPAGGAPAAGGEFTRMFAAESPATPEAKPAPGSGEFTRMFDAGAPEASKAPAVTPPADGSVPPEADDRVPPA